MENLNENSAEEAAEEQQVQKVPAPPRPRLNDNIIYLTIEKMFFALGREGTRHRTEMDLRADNAHTRFMTLNRVHFNAMLAQFAKMERICIGGGKERNSVSFYRNEDHILTYNDTEQQSVFSGPYNVTDHFVSRLIHYGKLRTSHVRTNDCLTNKEPIKMPLEGKKPLEIFSALFLDEVIEVPGDYGLEIKKLELHEKHEAIERHFETILALNPDEIVLHSFKPHVNKALFFDCKADQSGKLTTCTTRKITFYHNFSFEEPKKEFALLAQTWSVLILHLAKVCPNNLSQLEFKVCPNNPSQLEFKIGAYFGVSIAVNFLGAILQLVETVQGMLSELADGSPQLKIRLKLCSLLPGRDYQRLQLESHELFQLGTAITLENIGTRRYIARAIKIADKLGREHEFVFVFKMFFKNFWTMAYNTDWSDDSDPSD